VSGTAKTAHKAMHVSFVQYIFARKVIYENKNKKIRTQKKYKEQRKQRFRESFQKLCRKCKSKRHHL
jgi:ABC-type transporter lipoprotein component MlaA